MVASAAGIEKSTQHGGRWSALRLLLPVSEHPSTGSSWLTAGQDESAGQAPPVIAGRGPTYDRRKAGTGRQETKRLVWGRNARTWVRNQHTADNN